jgi:hypothetical protein
MADITKCNDQECTIKHTCYRFTAPADEYLQSYFAESPRKNDECDWFWGRSQELTMKQIKDILNGK